MKLTAEHYRIAEQNGISRYTAYSRIKHLGWDIETSITKPPQKQMPRKSTFAEYAVYKGETIVCMGTAKECAEHLNIKLESFLFCLTPTYRKRAAGRKDLGNRRVVIKLEEDDDEDESTNIG